MNHQILHYYQDLTRTRGYPPKAVEIAVQFGIDPCDAGEQIRRINQHLTEVLQGVEIPKLMEEPVLHAKLPPKDGYPPFEGDIHLFKVTGRNGWPNERDRMIYWSTTHNVSYVPGSVDYVLHDEMIALTPETERWFYSADVVVLPDYPRGSRPFLEQVAAEATRNARTDRAKAIALVRLIGDSETNPYRHLDPNWQPFLGGREEEVLRKAWRMCNEISRVLNFLCTIVGLPARSVFVFTDPVTGVDGHAMTEIYFEGKWNLVEQNYGTLYLMDDGYFASLIEVRDNPKLLTDREDCGKTCCSIPAMFQGPIAFLPYRIDRTAHYQYPWQANVRP
jgi:hypothetical protein